MFGNRPGVFGCCLVCAEHWPGEGTESRASTPDKRGHLRQAKATEKEEPEKQGRSGEGGLLRAREEAVSGPGVH